MSRSQIRRISLLALTLGVGLLAGCKDLSNAVNGPTSTTATLTLWTSDPSPSYIAVQVDGNTVGTLTAYRASAPDCGASSTAGTITITVAPGSHTISARETNANGYWGPSQVSVDAGKCLTYEFQP